MFREVGKRFLRQAEGDPPFPDDFTELDANFLPAC